MTVLDIRDILEHLPHRYPMLLIDRVIELEKGKRIRAIKNVSINEPFFQGHFPYLPVMPGVLQIEALAQAAGVLSFQTMGRVSDEGSVYYFVGVDGARFKRPVVPGDQLLLEVEILRISRSIWKYAGKTTVEGQLCCEAELMCTLRDVEAPAGARQHEAEPPRAESARRLDPPGPAAPAPTAAVQPISSAQAPAQAASTTPTAS